MKSVHTHSSQSLSRSLRRRIGRPIQSLAHATGMMRLAAGAHGQQGAVILMYHTVAEGDARDWVDPRNHVPAEIFAEQMQFLATHRRMVALSELVEMLERGVVPPAKTVAITFDDGYLDNLTVAAPILASHDLPATIFLPSAIIDRREPQWIDQVWSAFRGSSSETLRCSDAEGADLVFDLRDPAARDAAHRAVCRSLLTAAPAARRDLLQELGRQLPVPAAPPALTMSWDDVRTLMTRFPRFEIGGHTVEHTALTVLSREEADAELRGCMDALERHTGVRPQHFSFPYGQTSPSLRARVRETGFRSACGSGGRRGPVIRDNVDPCALPRVEAPPSMKRFALLTDSVNTGLWRRLGR